MAEISLILVKGGKQYDITQLVDTVKWSGKKGGAARSLSVTLLDDAGYGHDRSGIKVEDGQQVMFKVDGEEAFRGLIMSQTQNSKKRLTFKAYDNGIYLANNRDTFSYKRLLLMMYSEIYANALAFLTTRPPNAIIK